MANHKSAIKRHRQSLKRRERNRVAKSTVKTAIRATNEALEKGDAKEAQTTLRQAISKLAKASSKGILNKKTAARRVSRIAKRVAAKTK